MKRRVMSFALAMLLVVGMTIPVAARSNVITDVDPFLSFSGNTAECSLIVWTNDDDATITAHITLSVKVGNDYEPVAMWRNRTGTGSLYFYDEATNRYNGEYELKVDVSASGFLGSDHVVAYAYATCRNGLTPPTT